jgi:shikimate dehydrogenase
MRNFGLVGKSLGHSFSKTFFEDYFRKNQIDAVFNNYELGSIDEVKNLLKSGVTGLTVTIPYKETIIPFLDELSEEARAIGAVNVVQFTKGKTIGHNSDAFGFRQSIKPFLTNLHERALILGTGGASKAVAHVFRSIGIDVIYCSRQPEGKDQFSYDDINEHMVKACKVIVNCTPIGTYPNVEDHIQFPFQYLTANHLVIDLIYNPAKTKFLELAQLNDATILNGESMLKEQALRAWQIWNQE